MRAKLLEEEVKKSCHSFSTPRISSSIEARGVDDTAKILDFYCTAGTLARNIPRSAHTVVQSAAG